jgi:hypothetical protein
MDIVLDRLEFAAAYLDDVIIHSRTWDDHLHHPSAPSQCGLYHQAQKISISYSYLCVPRAHGWQWRSTPHLIQGASRQRISSPEVQKPSFRPHRLLHTALHCRRTYRPHLKRCPKQSNLDARVPESFQPAKEAFVLIRSRAKPRLFPPIYPTDGCTELRRWSCPQVV